MTVQTDMSSEAVTHRLKQMEGLWLLGTALGKVEVVSQNIDKKNRGLEIRAAIRNVFLTLWDPISVADEGLTGEYDSYIAPIYRIMVTTRDEGQVLSALQRIEREELGLESSGEVKLRAVSKALLSLDVRL